nr:Squalene phytoene synthase [Hymenolepis microstoma]
MHVIYTSRVSASICIKLLRFASTKAITDQAYCRELVKKADYFNFLCCLPLPQPQQRFAFALRAFNAEISLIRDRAPTPQTASLRFQYWEDSIKSLFNADNDKPPGEIVHRSPIESELSWSVNKFAGCISRHWLLRILMARRERVGDVAFQSSQELEEYADSTNAPLHYALAEALGHKSLSVDHALSHLAKAQGIVTHLRSVVLFANRYRNVILPTDLLVKHNLPAEVALRLCRNDQQFDSASLDSSSVERLRDVSQALATRARYHTIKALSFHPMESKKTSSLTLLLLPSVPVCRLLKIFADPCNFDPRHPRWLQPQLEKGLMPLRIAWYTAIKSTPKPP